MLAGIKGEIDYTIVVGVSNILFLTMEGYEKNHRGNIRCEVNFRQAEY